MKSTTILQDTTDMWKEPYDFPAALEEIIQGIREYYPRFEERQAERIREAFVFGYEAHKEQKRFSGEPYFFHPVEATKILLTIRPDVDTVCACLLHDVIEDTPVTAEDIEARFGSAIRFLCEGVEKVSKLSLREDQKGHKLETLKKLFLAMAQDIRVVFVKLADRIHNLETLEHVRPEKRARIAKESLKIYAPVAEKLGLFDFKQRIEDLCFEYLQPEAYQMLRLELARHLDEQTAFIDRAKKDLRALFGQKNIKIMGIKGRQKNLASLYEKMKRKNLNSITEVYDLVGFRILTRTTPGCYRVLGALHSHWTPMPGRFKDYISVPKPNGYQSLHTTVLGLGGSKLPTEIQIRTKKMDLDAEKGPAAHWAYKKRKNSTFDADYVKRMEWFPSEILASEEDAPADKFFQAISQNILSDRIYVFTPKGDTITLKSGSTPVDFAYAIHSEVGDTISGAKVNGVMRPISYKLQNGEIIEILTKPGRSPNPAWLDFVKSSAAKQRIQGYINSQRKEEEEPSISLTEKEPIKQNLAELKADVTQSRTREKDALFPAKGIVWIGGQTDAPYVFATCCNPRQGDDIVAYKSRGLSFTIHRKDCKSLASLDPERMLPAAFIRSYTLMVKAHPNAHHIPEIMATLVRYEARPVFFQSEERRGESTTKMKVHMPMIYSIDDLLQALQNLESVYQTNIIQEGWPMSGE